MRPLVFKTARKLANKATAYFRYIEGDYQVQTKAGKDQKIYSREPEPATLTGLALFIGFNSRQELDDYEQNGEFGYVIKRSRLQVEALYEKKLHQQSPSGAVFALKNMGWKDKPDDRQVNENRLEGIKIEIIDTGPKTAANEVEVIL
ncbi:MAG TPA: terminase small subunit [Mucilaginibacter sp.]|nr:terminase small subunit [Mucilaginibacter sp.]